MSNRMTTTADIPLSLYVHMPWCRTKCPYCDFNSWSQPQGALPATRYLQALLADLHCIRNEVDEREWHSIFIGGGTPSLMPGAAIAELLKQTMRKNSDIEVTMEANPGSADQNNFAACRRAGVNRLSLGAQTFDDRYLRKIGRTHTADDARHAFRAGRAAGFTNINTDLMYGLPGQTTDDALNDLRAAIALEPEHISWYQLTLEPGTRFHTSPPPAMPDDDRLADIEEPGRAILAQAGYERYEVSAYARPGHTCAHNINYWLFGDYHGIGAGAHGKWTDADGKVWRAQRVRNPDHYMHHAGTDKAISHRQPVPSSDLPLEFSLNAFRLCRGFPISLFAERTRLRPDALLQPLSSAIAADWISANSKRIVPTRHGMNFLNDLLAAYA